MFVYNIAVPILRFLCRIFFRMEIIGAENIPLEGGYILASNHKHFLDPVFLAVGEKNRKLHMVGKKELFKNRFTKWLFENAGVIAIDRDKPELKTIKEIIKLLKNGHILGIFPEGTRVKGTELGEGKAGIGMFVTKGKADIIPCAVVSSYKVFSKVKVIYGEPVSMEKYYSRKTRSDEYPVISGEIMDEIGKLYYPEVKKPDIKDS